MIDSRFVIPYQRYHFAVEPIDAIHLPFFKGSTLRGGFGITFRRIVCALKRQDCRDCMLAAKCVYAYVFETSPGPVAQHDGSTDSRPSAILTSTGRYEKIPHPFIIEPPLEFTREYHAGEILVFSLVLVGRAVDYLPYFVFTFEELGKTGIGKGRGKYRLRTVSTEAKPPGPSQGSAPPGETLQVIYSGEGKTLKPGPAAMITLPSSFEDAGGPGLPATLRFLTPLRLQYQRRLTDDIQFHILFRSLLRRIQLLHFFHCAETEIPWDVKKAIEVAQEVRVTNQSLHWWDWERYSSRQDTKLKMGGVLGQITYEGLTGPLMELLQAGEILHVGKGTSFGLGRYDLTVPG